MIRRPTKYRSYISGSRANGIEHDHGVQAGKHLLGFPTLLLYTETKNGALRGIASSYLSALVRLLKVDSFQTHVLQDSLLVTLSVLTRMPVNASSKTFPEFHYDSIWNLDSFSKKQSMISSCTPLHP